jgi:hypothetical protein
MTASMSPLPILISVLDFLKKVWFSGNTLNKLISVGLALWQRIVDFFSWLIESIKARVETLGQGDVLLVIDAENDQINDIDEMVLDNLAAGCTAPGVLGGSIRNGANAFDIGDCSGAPVWIRTLQFCASEVEVPFSYQEPLGTTQNGTGTISAGSPAGTTVLAIMAETHPDAIKILGTTYSGTLSFDIFMGKGTYPRLWVASELQAVDISLELVLTATPEVDLLANIQASLEAKLDSYKIGEDLEYADLVKYIYVDYRSGLAFSGIDDVASFNLTCKSSSITGFGQKVTLEDDERIEPGTISIIVAT